MMNDNIEHLKKQSSTTVMVEREAKVYCFRVMGYMSQMGCGRLTVWGANGRKVKIEAEEGASIEIHGHSPEWLNKSEDPEIVVSSAFDYTIEDIPVKVWFEEEEN